MVPAEPVHDLPAGMKCVRIPAHTYAVGEVRGSRGEIDRVYSELPEWAASLGAGVNKAILWLEIYPNGPCIEPNEPMHFDIYLPVR
jgi:predicted transcriptional regulator YdeE